MLSTSFLTTTLITFTLLLHKTQGIFFADPRVLVPFHKSLKQLFCRGFSRNLRPLYLQRPNC